MHPTRADRSYAVVFVAFFVVGKCSFFSFLFCEAREKKKKKSTSDVMRKNMHAMCVRASGGGRVSVGVGVGVPTEMSTKASPMTANLTGAGAEEDDMASLLLLLLRSVLLALFFPSPSTDTAKQRSPFFICFSSTLAVASC